MNEQGWKILLVDDDRDDYLLTRSSLAEFERVRVDVRWAAGYTEGLKALAEGAYDAALIDYHLGEQNGLNFIRDAAQSGYRLPFILLTSSNSYDLDVAAMQAGASDFLSKDETSPRLLERSLRYAIERFRLQEENRQQRDLFQAVMDHLPEILIIAEGPEVRLRVVSKHGKSISAVSRELLIGKTLAEYGPLLQIYTRDGRTPLPPEEFPLSRASRGEVVINEALVMRAEDGRLIHLTCNAAPIKDARGAITGSLTTMIDVTESQRLANALRLSEARFRSIVDANVIPLAMWNADGRILEANDAFLHLVGYTRQELQEGKLRWSELTPPEYAERDRRAMEEMAVGSPATPFEKEFLLRNGRRVPVLIGGALIGDYGDRGWTFAIDLTDRKQTEVRLAYHARLLENVHDAIIATDEEFAITAWNRAAEELYGWNADEVIGRRLSDVVRSEITATVFQEALNLLDERGAYRLEIAQYTRDQRKLLIESSMITLRDASGRINGYVSANRDATARIQASKEREELLRRLEQQQARLSAVINNAPVGILVADPEARILLANPAGERLIACPIPYGRHYDTHSRMNLHDAQGNPYDPRSLPLTRSALDGERFENLEIQVVWPDGQRREWLINCAPILGAEGDREGAVAIFQDITERRRAAEELQHNAARIEIQRYLSRAREQERLTIAHDLHDGPLQELIGLSFSLSEMLALAADGGLDRESSFSTDLSYASSLPVTGKGFASREAEILRQLNGMQEQVHGLIREMRAFCNELRPPALTPFGLERAIRSHADTFRSLHPEIDLSLALEHDGQMLPESVRSALFQVYRESLNNILKHAQATEIAVTFGLEEGTAVLQVRDNGRGFRVPSQWVELARQGHLGLVGIQERAEAVGGSVRLSSSPGKGTALRVTVPYGSSAETEPLSQRENG